MSENKEIDVSDSRPAPIIGISGQAPASASVIAMMTQIRAMGGKTVFLDHSNPKKAEEDLGKLDGLVIMGSDYDVNPQEYGAALNPKTNPAPANDPALAADIKKRAEYETTLIEGALKRQLPLVGICAGMQRINVKLGGTLHQHLPELLGNNSYNQAEAGIPPYTPVHHIGIRPGSMLSHISEETDGLYAPRFEDNMPPEMVKENAFHHQAVAKIGNGLTVSALSEDGVIEAVEPDPNGPYANQFVLGVQFHPEFSASKLGPNIASTLVDKALEYSFLHPKKRVANTAWTDFVASRPLQQVQQIQR